MLKDFQQFVSTLPDFLDEKEQGFLFYKMVNLKCENSSDFEKYNEIREKLIAHNLRLCANFATNYCINNNCLNMIEDVYGESIVELVKSIDNYDISCGEDFSNFAYRNMQTNCILSENVNDVECFDDDLITNLFVSSTNIDNNFAENEFVSNIINFINSMPNERNIDIIKMRFGIDYDRCYSCIEIGEKFGLSRQYVHIVVNSIRDSIVRYLIDNYPLSYEEFINKYRNQNPNFDDFSDDRFLTFASKKERNEYIYNSYYGLNGLCKKSINKLSHELDMSEEYLTSLISRLDVQKSEINLDKLAEGNSAKYDEMIIAITCDYYGLNGNEMLSKEDIFVKYNITNMRTALLNKLLLKGKNLLGLNDEEWKVLKERRDKLDKSKMFERRKLCYMLYYGLNGYDKLTINAIAEMVGIHRNYVIKDIDKFQEYLDGLWAEEREEILAGETFEQV